MIVTPTFPVKTSNLFPSYTIRHQSYMRNQIEVYHERSLHAQLLDPFPVSVPIPPGLGIRYDILIYDSSDLMHIVCSTCSSSKKTTEVKLNYIDLYVEDISPPS